MVDVIKVSPLGKTWIFDIDGTIVEHNGYILNGYDTFLPGAKEFLNAIPQTDMIIFITSRDESLRKLTEELFAKNNIRYDKAIFNAPYGERILVNDRKPSGLNVSLAINTERDCFMQERFETDDEL